MYNSINNQENPDRIEIICRLYDMGFNLLPTEGNEKRPAVTWKQYQTERVAQEQLSKWIKEFQPQNLVLIAGGNSLDRNAERHRSSGCR